MRETIQFNTQIKIQESVKNNYNTSSKSGKNFDELLKQNTIQDKDLEKRSKDPGKQVVRPFNESGLKSKKEIIEANSDEKPVEKQSDTMEIPIENLAQALQSLLTLLQNQEAVDGEQKPEYISLLENLVSLEEINQLVLKEPTILQGMSFSETKEQLDALLQELTTHIDSGLRIEDLKVAAGEDDSWKDMLLTAQQMVEKLKTTLQEEQGQIEEVEAPVVNSKEVLPQIKEGNPIEVETAEAEVAIFKNNETSILQNVSEETGKEKNGKDKKNDEQSITLQISKVENSSTGIKEIHSIPFSEMELVNLNAKEDISLNQAAIVKPTFAHITEQILPKAEILISEERSEMLIQLKPDNLGKLVMKLEVERGIVIAKFMAESHMVKEILESNMNTLKDALQQKGLDVQELNVFVGEQGNFQQQQNFMSFQKRQQGGAIKGIDSSYGDEMEGQAVKSLHSTNIDFLA